MNWSTFAKIYAPLLQREGGTLYIGENWLLDGYYSLWYNDAEEVGRAIKPQLASNGIFTVEELFKQSRTNSLSARNEQNP